MRSMTGFGSGTFSDGKLSVTIEIKAVNQRFLELNIRMPRAYMALEDRLRNAVKKTIYRGKVDMFVTVTELERQPQEIRIDYAALEACKVALDTAKQRFFNDEPATLGEIISLCSDWFTQEPPVIDTKAVRPVFDNAVTQALDAITAMRDREGEIIHTDLLKRADLMEEYIDSIAGKREDIVTAYAERLHNRIVNLLEPAGVPVDEGRILQEVAVFADKSDFTEEVVRLRSHVLQLKKLLNSGGDVGRSLDFLIQEINRETNTVGAKTQDMDVTETVLHIKNELEKVREQIQNIE